MFSWILHLTNVASGGAVVVFLNPRCTMAYLCYSWVISTFCIYYFCVVSSVGLSLIQLFSMFIYSFTAAPYKTRIREIIVKYLYSITWFQFLLYLLDNISRDRR